MDFLGTALNGAVEVSVDARGRVRSVRLHPRVVTRLGPEQLGRGVLAAHADGRAAALAADGRARPSWDHHAPRGEIDRAVDGYATRIARETATAKVGLVAAVLRLDGVLVDLVVDPRARRLDPDELAEMTTQAIRAGEHEVSARRDAIGEEVTLRGRPVLALVREMIADPQATVRRLAAEADVRRQ